MDTDLIDPSLRAPLAKLPAMHLEWGWMRALAAAGSRLMPGAQTDGVARRVVHDGAARLRLYVPEGAGGSGLLWIHGGGLVLGAAKMDDRFCGETARELGVTIASVDYRLAPRHPFPAALDDARAGWEWLQAHAAALGVDRGRIAVGGQSAGGGLAAALVQRLHDEGEAVAAQWLWCPMLDDRTAADRDRDAIEHSVWSNRSNSVGWTAYLGGAPGAASAPPYAVPARRTDLAGLPPAWVYVSDIELFHDEDVAYAAALEAAGVDTTFELVHGAPHGFEAWARDTPLAQDLFARGRAWLGDRLASPPGR